MNGRSDLLEETKLRLLAALKDAGKPLKTDDWAKAAKVGRATIFRYLPLIKVEGWLKETMGPGRSILYSVKANKAVLPVDQIPKVTSSQHQVSLRMPKNEIPEKLAYLLSKANDQPLVSGSTYTTGILGKTLATLYTEVARARSGEMANKENLDAARVRLSQQQKTVEGLLTLLNGMLMTPELWDPRTINEYLSLNADTIQLAQWATSADDTSDLLIAILQALAQGNYTVTEGSISFDL